MARIRIDFRHGGYVSYDESERERAEEVYEQSGFRMRVCRDIHDEGVVVRGPAVFEDMTDEPWRRN